MYKIKEDIDMNELKIFGYYRFYDEFVFDYVYQRQDKNNSDNYLSIGCCDRIIYSKSRQPAGINGSHWNGIDNIPENYAKEEDVFDLIQADLVEEIKE